MAAGKIEARPYRKLGTKTFSILLSLQPEMSYLETESGLKRFLFEAKVEPTPGGRLGIQTRIARSYGRLVIPTFGSVPASILPILARWRKSV